MMRSPSRATGASKCSSGACCAQRDAHAGPDRRQSEQIREDVVGQRTAEIGQQRRRLPLVCCHRIQAHETHGSRDRDARIEDALAAGADFDVESRAVEMRAQRREDACAGDRRRIATGNAPSRGRNHIGRHARRRPCSGPAPRSCSSRRRARRAKGRVRPNRHQSWPWLRRRLRDWEQMPNQGRQGRPANRHLIPARCRPARRPRWR